MSWYSPPYGSDSVLVKYEAGPAEEYLRSRNDRSEKNYAGENILSGLLAEVKMPAQKSQQEIRDEASSKGEINNSETVIEEDKRPKDQSTQKTPADIGNRSDPLVRCLRDIRNTNESSPSSCFDGDKLILFGYDQPSKDVGEEMRITGLYESAVTAFFGESRTEIESDIRKNKRQTDSPEDRFSREEVSVGDKSVLTVDKAYTDLTNGRGEPVWVFRGATASLQTISGSCLITTGGRLEATPEWHKHHYSERTSAEDPSEFRVVNDTIDPEGISMPTLKEILIRNNQATVSRVSKVCTPQQRE